MPAPKQRKMALVGSRSVGEQGLVRSIFEDVLTRSPRQIVPYSPVRGQPVRRQLLPDH